MHIDKRFINIILNRQEWYTVIDKDGKSKERYLFLFKARILVCKVRRISEDRSVFVLKDIIRVSDTFQIFTAVLSVCNLVTSVS